MIVRSRAPLRLGLAGGGTDVSPFCDEYGGFVLNGTIDLYAYTTLVPRIDGRVFFESKDRGRTIEAPAGNALEPEGDLALPVAVYNHVVRCFHGGVPIPISVTTYTDVPAGSGLGSSSTLVVSLIKAFVELLGLPLGEYDIARLAYQIERVELGLKGGRQDQYAATFGGINFMEFSAGNKVIVNPLRIKQWILSEFESSMVLFYTGVSRESGKIIEEQVRNFREHNAATLGAMMKLKEEAVAMKECLLLGDLGRFAKHLGESWHAKKKVAANISNPGIDGIYESALAAGALAGKVSGAGGGGFIMFLVDPVRRSELLTALRRHPGVAMNCHFTRHGTEGWKIL